MNAPFDHWIAEQGIAGHMKVHVNSLLGTASGSARRDARRLQPGAYISPRRDTYPRYSIPADVSAIASGRTSHGPDAPLHPRVTVRHPRHARKERLLGTP